MLGGMKGTLSLVVIAYTINFGTALYTKRSTSEASDDHNHAGSAVDSDSSTDEPTVIIDKWPASFFDGVDFENRSKELDTLAENGRRKREVSCNKRGIISIVVYYDDAFYERFGDNSIIRLTEVLGRMQRILEMDSFTFRINGQIVETLELNVLQIKRLSGLTLFINDGSTALYSFVAQLRADSSKPDANHYMLFSNQDNAYGIVGQAFRGTTCYYLKHYRASITEYFFNDQITADFAAHEFGHSLGASHDFGSSTSTARHDSAGKPCTNIRAVMDYDYYPNKWSTCSMEDLEKYFRIYATRLCFPLESACQTTTPTTSSTTTSTTTQTTNSTTTSTATPTTNSTTTSTTTPTTNSTTTSTTTPTTTSTATPTTNSTTTSATTPTTTSTTSSTTSPTTTSTTTPTTTSSTTPTTTSTTTPTTTSTTTPTTTSTTTPTTTSTTTPTTTSTTTPKTTSTTTPTTTSTTTPTTTSTTAPTTSSTTETTSTTTASTTPPVCSCEKFANRTKRLTRCCNKKPKRFHVKCCAGCDCWKP